MNQNPFPPRKSSVSPQRPFYTEFSAVQCGNRWEKNVYYGIRQYLYSGPEPKGYVHHLIKPVYHGRYSGSQIIDILVDNVDGRSFGIECKSSQQQKVRLSPLFRHSGEDGQLARETEFLLTSGRIGALAFVMWEAGSPETSPRFCAYLVPWSMVLMIGSRVITTDILDGYTKAKLIIKIPTTNGTFTLPQDVDIFGTLAKMEKKAGKIASDEKKREILRAKPSNPHKPKKGR